MVIPIRSAAGILRAVIARFLFGAAVTADLLGLARWSASLRFQAHRRGYDRRIRKNLLGIEELVQGEQPPEDLLSNQRQRWIEAERELSSYIDSGFSSHNAYRLHAMLAQKLKDTDRAVDRWERVLESEGDAPRADTVANLLLSCRRTARFDRAAQLTQDLPSEIRSDPRVRRVELSISRQLDLRAGGATIRELVTGEASDPHLEARLEAAIAQVGMPPSLHEPLRNVLLRCADLHRHPHIDLTPYGEGDDSPAAPELQQAHEEPRIIITSGFGWSGSGAVSDLLRDHAAPDEPYPPPEVLLFRTRWGNTPVHRVISDVRARELRPTRVVDCILTSVLGLSPRDLDGVRYELATKKSALGHLLDDVQAAKALLGACDEFLRNLTHEVSGGSVSQSVVRRILTRFVQQALAPRPLGSSGLALLDNAMHPTALRALDILPSATAFVVVRDPKDQFVDMTSARGSTDAPLNEEIDGFVHSQRRMYEDFRQLVEREGRTSDIRCVRFEDVVHDEGVQRGLLDVAGVGEASPARSSKTRFQPERSAANIGLYRQWEDQRALERIDSELRPLIDEVVSLPDLELGPGWTRKG